eukprot:GHVU01185170.1.p1 GENE.GHVU01185170.1~~GHVU01185170.1.p1  ORF type:complete len:356 (+),score=49.01 GHVU01185170.1:123-1190(+)
MAEYCSASTLSSAIKESKPKETSHMGQNFSFMTNPRSFIPFDLPKNKYDEVYPGIILGNHYLAYATGELKKLKITHILNACQGTSFSQVDTNQQTYDIFGIKFMGIKAMDTSAFNLAPFFPAAADFIDEALKTPQGKVYVHCHQGISRSATLVTVFLMTKRGMTAPDALKTIRAKRSVMPNHGFLKQIANLHNEIYVYESDVEGLKDPENDGATNEDSGNDGATNVDDVDVKVSQTAEKSDNSARPASLPDQEEDVSPGQSKTTDLHTPPSQEIDRTIADKNAEHDQSPKNVDSRDRIRNGSSEDASCKSENDAEVGTDKLDSVFVTDNPEILDTGKTCDCLQCSMCLGCKKEGT